ncbi:unnamed protein product [Clonostachys chloroleuca]|uniref:FAD/NAD(P)-binding domain-containing protein n=1 Tax=Clonostachys chloroleuca TaxID=1926264 RepID=A0AA35Q839_9HYPO|nr:unnamed protein product [Clonostachys chloroleuca]
MAAARASKIFDVLIIGGGPAGLTFAGSLARQLHTALILDSGVYRNDPTNHMHNVPGWDHAHPSEFRAKLREDLAARYHTVEYKKGTVNSVRKLEAEDLFEAVDEDGVVYQSRKLALATGVRDRTEAEVKGYAECWGRGVFHCLYCEGYEQRGADSVGALATGYNAEPEMFLHVAHLAKRLSGQVNLYTNGNEKLAASLPAHIKSSKIVLDPRPIESLSLVDGGPQVRVNFADGTSRVEGFIVSHPTVEQRAKYLTEQLGLETTPLGHVVVEEPFKETSVKGCFAAGDMATPVSAVTQAMHMGTFAAIGTVSQLQAELEAKDAL